VLDQMFAEHQIRAGVGQGKSLGHFQEHDTLLASAGIEIGLVSAHVVEFRSHPAV
jgi:hypothetical protein